MKANIHTDSQKLQFSQKFYKLRWKTFSESWDPHRFAKAGILQETVKADSFTDSQKLQLSKNF